MTQASPIAATVAGVRQIIFFAHSVLVSVAPYFFFFKQKTAYEITYGDWSSDVCSSDLQEAREVARFVGHNNDVTDEINRLHALWTTFWPLLMLAVHATTIGVWVLAVPRLLGGGAALSAGTFVSFLLYTTMFVGPIEVIGQMARTMQRATTSAHRVFEVLDTEPDVRDAPRPLRLEPQRAGLPLYLVHGVQGLEHAMRRSRGAL